MPPPRSPRRASTALGGRASRRLLGAVALSLALAGGVFASGVLVGSLDQGLQARVAAAKAELRLALGLPKQWNTAFPTDTAGHARLPCPDPAETLVIVTGGQSNAANALSTPLARGEDVYTFFEGACFATQDPVLGATGGRGSLWTRLGGALHARTGAPVLFVHGAVGGSAYGDWLDARSGYLARLLDRVAAARAQGFEPRWIVWHQGETDAVVPEIDAPALETQIEDLGARLLAAAPQAELYLFRASRCTGAIRAEGREEVRAVQAQASEGIARARLGMITDALGDEHRYDGCHFNARGRDAVVARLAQDLVPDARGAALRR